MQALTVWASVLCVFAVYSFLWAENRFFRAFQNLFVGLAAGYTMVVAIKTIQRQALVPLFAEGQLWLIVPVVLGITLFARLIKGSEWLARWPVAFMMGIGAALSIKTFESQFMAQIKATMIPLDSVNSFVLVIGTALALSYFFFTVRPNSVTNNASRVGRWVLMITFGAAFGNAVQGRLTLVISQMTYLLRDWLHIIQ